MVAAVAVGSLVVIAARRREKNDVVLRVVVSGRAQVKATPGGAVCTTRCAWRFSRTTRVRLRAAPARGARFLGWQDACSGAGCSLLLTRSRRVVARFEQRGDGGLQSWSFHTSCRPVRTTIEELVGSHLGPDGAPLEDSGRFRPHLRGPSQQHLLHPRCSLRRTPTFVEIDDVAVSGPVDRRGGGDVMIHLFDTRRPDVRNLYLKTLRVEIDATWLRAGVPLPDFPPQPARIDVQGFLFWDTGHLVGETREPSGWELHPVSDWLPALRR